MMKYADELSRIWDSALADAVKNTEAATENRTAAPNNRTSDGLFAETAKFSNRQREEDTIKRQIKDNLEELNDMEPVASIYDSLDMGKDKGQYRKWIVDKLASTGYQVDRKGFGKITFTPKQLNAGINYVNDPAEMAAFLTIPKVLKQGAEIREHDNHKERNVETITFSAPVEINGTRGNVAVVVKLTKNYFKALRILTPEGKVYSLSGYEKTELTPTQHTPTSGAESASISSVNNTIPQSGEESNTKYSMRERDEDLQKKYPRLNLNEDISELDGVPAIELTDGSILPIKDRERYRTHVSFIEGNRIDVDDLRSGGWIGNGVYDASFTSDTARYIEQQQAKKRVAELRGVPYDQFGDGNTRYSMRDTAYTTAVESGNTEDAQRLVDEAAEEALENSEARLTDRGEFRMGAGKLATVYHATYNDFTVFDRAKLGENTDAYASDESTAATAHLGFWFNTQPLSQSASYAGGKDVKAYLNAENIYNAHSLEQLTGEIEQQWDEELTPEENAEEYVDGLKAQGYDGIVLKDEEFGGTSFVVFDPEQIKSAEAITYDDAGNVIPLSERFNSRSNDIRYSMRDVAADDTADFTQPEPANNFAHKS